MSNLVRSLLDADVSSIVQEEDQVLGLEKALPSISPEDYAALASWGLPANNRLRPFPTPGSVSLGVLGRDFEIGTLDNSLLVVVKASGVVLNTDRNTKRFFVNSSIRQFAETAWRYHRIRPLALQAEREDEDSGEIWQAFWSRAVEIDPHVDLDRSVSYWQGILAF